MSRIAKSKKVVNKPGRKETPLVVYLWIFGLGLMGYVMGRLVLASFPHPWHWIAGLAGGILGYFVGRLWYNWRGDVI